MFHAKTCPLIRDKDKAVDSTVAFFYTHLHGSPFMVRPRPFLRAHKQEASGGVFGPINSPKVTLKGSEKGPE